DQLDERIPDWVIHPTAGGTGIYAMWKGFQELLALGWIERAPQLVASQSAAAAPLVAAFEKGWADIEPVVARDTVAESIQVGNPGSPGWETPGWLPRAKGTRGGCARPQNPRSAVADRRARGYLRRPRRGHVCRRRKEAARKRRNWRG